MLATDLTARRKTARFGKIGTDRVCRELSKYRTDRYSPAEEAMHSIFYIIGVVVVVLALLNFIA
jgi:hypothetical protein